MGNMKILLLEDRSIVYENLSKALKDKNYDIDLATSITEAKEYFFANEYNCLIIDLNMDPLGLDNDLIKDTDRGFLTGWVWIKNYVLFNKPEYRSRIIIYSAYMDRFHNVPLLDRDGIITIAKLGDNFEKVIEKVEFILNNI